jgi:hypothetical protein
VAIARRHPGKFGGSVSVVRPRERCRHGTAGCLCRLWLRVERKAQGPLTLSHNVKSSLRLQASDHSFMGGRCLSLWPNFPG